MYIEISSEKERNFNNPPIFQFHIAAKLRKKYDVSEELFSISGNVVFANLGQVRKFVNNFNKSKNDNEKLKVSEVNAAALIDEIFHYIIRRYEDELNPKVFSRAIDHLEEVIGEEELRKLLYEFIELFPPMEVYRGKSTPYDYLRSYTGNKSNKEITLEEMFLLNFANINPANEKLRELFDENYFSDKEIYSRLINQLEIFLEEEVPIGTGEFDLFNYLMKPILSNPDSLSEQLDFILDNWDIVLKDKFINRVLSNKDLLKEEITFEFGGGGGSAPTIVPKYKGEYKSTEGFTLEKSLFNYANDINTTYEETEQFTSDIHWMPNVILMAKNIYVWLDQLSKKYQREIKSLDQIPNAELDELARRNINGLWMIGLWERSSASKKIKHIMGNIDAVASAYSLYDYQIAYDIGGEEAYNNLNERAKSRGIRLASDMVPNHTGIHSDWVRNHPEYFVQVSEPPFNYSYTGEDLSEDPNIEIKIEDGYWEKRDAAVVFRRIDKRNNDVRYIYHGNDGTNMPWNDTAQLDMLKHEVREAVMQKIFDVARKFSIIRFDAAMTLAKKHFSRLWYPQPGMGGDIPSRTDHSMSRAEFDSFFPVEFWREVVDRINHDMPQTLLLAEAFWLMEGYFVRTLGMHRVYNSAFMHMMMKEENSKYRELIYNTLEFEPEILKRYVNFMSNPDEETSIQQFGTDDKYFGVLTLMITLPGLPMFAHGQIEGYTEKYGMEYKRAYYDEQPKDWLVDRHEKEIFPITRRRHLFSEVENFWFYDFYDLNGNLNDNVFVYSNNAGNEKSLVLYNNKYDKVYGNFQKSTPKLIKIDDNNKFIKELNITEALSINGNNNYFYIFKDMSSNLEYIFMGSDLWQNGFYFELNGFERRVYTDIKEVEDTNGDYYDIYLKLNGRGVHSIEDVIEDKKLTPIYETFAKLFEEVEIENFIEKLVLNPTRKGNAVVEFKTLTQKLKLFINEVKLHTGIEITYSEMNEVILAKFEIIKNLNLMIKTESSEEKEKNINLTKYYTLSARSNYLENSKIILAWLILNEVELKIADISEAKKLTNKILNRSFADSIYRTGKGHEEVVKTISLLEVLLEDFNDITTKEKTAKINLKKKQDIIEYLLSSKKEFVRKLFEDNYVHKYLEVNIYKDIRYFNKERFEEFVKWLLNLFMINRLSKENNIKDILNLYCKTYEYMIESAEESGFQLDELEEILIHKNISK
jgi:glycosidase